MKFSEANIIRIWGHRGQTNKKQSIVTWKSRDFHCFNFKQRLNICDATILIKTFLRLSLALRSNKPTKKENHPNIWVSNCLDSSATKLLSVELSLELKNGMSCTCLRWKNGANFSGILKKWAWHELLIMTFTTAAPSGGKIARRRQHSAWSQPAGGGLDLVDGDFNARLPARRSLSEPEVATGLPAYRAWNFMGGKEEDPQ